MSAPPSPSERAASPDPEAARARARARAAWERTVRAAARACEGKERFTASLTGEASEFVRFSKNRIGQAGAVFQLTCVLRLVDDGRHATATFSLSGDPAVDEGRAEDAVLGLRERVRALPPDPHLLLPEEARSTERIADGSLVAGTDAVSELLRRSVGDRVGIYAGGRVFRAFASSEGQRNWFESESFDLSWSHVHESGRSIKEGYAGTRWSSAELEAKDRRVRAELPALGRPAHALSPGGTRAYLAPAALDELLSLLTWDAFGEASHRTRTSALVALAEGRSALSPKVTLSENVTGGTAPNFSTDGFPRPDDILLVDRGLHAGTLVSPRTAREFGVVTNGAADDESPDSLDLRGGGLAEDRVLAALGTGLLVSNLWYLNYSDRSAGRVTGMTRFATFWVEGGEIVAPVDAMRFDDTVYRMLGSELEDLTARTELRPSSHTYVQRSTSSARVPGALLRELVFTL